MVGVCVIHAGRFSFYFFDGLLDQAQTLPDLFVPNYVSVVGISRGSYRYVKFEILIRTVWFSSAQVIIDATCPQIRTCETII